MLTLECWAYISPTGNVIADSTFESEAVAWRIGLGWPDEEEIQRAKKRGARVVRVKITEVANADT